MRNPLLKKVFRNLDRIIERENARRDREDRSHLPRSTFKVLGQFSLLAHPDPLLSRLELAATVDVDAWVDAEYFVLSKFKAVLGRQGLLYDDDSPKIWIPPEATFTEIFRSRRLTVLDVDPLYALTSKAIKAKEKNRILVRAALEVYGDSLRRLIEKHGGSLNDFE